MADDVAKLPHATGPETAEGFPIGCGAFQPMLPGALDRVDLPGGEIVYLPLPSKPERRGWTINELGIPRGVVEVELPFGDDEEVGKC